MTFNLYKSFFAASLATVISAHCYSAQTTPKFKNTWFSENSKFGFKILVPSNFEALPPRMGVSGWRAFYAHKDLSTFCIFIDKLPKDGIWEQSSEESIENRIPIILSKYMKWTPPTMEVDHGALQIEGADSAHFSIRELDRKGEDLRMFVTTIQLDKHTRITTFGTGPIGSRWSKYETAYAKAANSFMRIEVEQGQSEEPSNSSKSRIQEILGHLDGWTLRGNGPVQIISNSKEKKFLRQLEERVNGLHRLLESEFGPSDSNIIGGDEPTKVDPELVPRNTTLWAFSAKTPINPMLWILPGREKQWDSEGNAIYVSDAKDGRDAQWNGIYTGLIRQHMLESFKDAQPAHWFKTGCIEHFRSCEFKKERAIVQPNIWRPARIQELIKSNSIPDLSKIVALGTGKNEANEKLGLNSYTYDAVAWSLIYFLRVGPLKKPRGWNPNWDGIFDSYVLTLLTTQDWHDAYEQAFTGVDWDSFTECWRRFNLKVKVKK